MNFAVQNQLVRNCLTSYFWSGDSIRSRSVSDVVLAAHLNIPTPPAGLIADWQRDTSQRLVLEPGGVDELSLARARMRWPHYQHCVAAVSDWMRTIGLSEALSTGDVALMTCRGAKYHHDAAQYGGMAFCNLLLSEDVGLDLHFPHTGQRIPMRPGTIFLFDTAQPHGVIERSSNGFHVDDFPLERECTQVFLSWEIPIENAGIRHALRINFDTVNDSELFPNEEQVLLNGEATMVCPQSGKWLIADGRQS